VTLLGSLLISACAHQPATQSSTESESPAQAEIAKLEKKIAEQKRSGSSSSSDPIQMSSGDGAGGRCDGVCQAAEEICTCHRRICKLAIDIGDEKSEGSCRRAQRECEEAGKLCASCH
jgi:hypothetical protein